VNFNQLFQDPWVRVTGTWKENMAATETSLSSSNEDSRIKKNTTINKKQHQNASDGRRHVDMSL